MPLSLRISISVAALLWLPRLLAAQQLDPSFRVAQIYKVAGARQVVQQPDGKRLVLGNFVRVAHQQAPACGLVRLLANSDQPDSVFLQNISALTGYVRQFLLLANGKILVAGGNGLTLQSGAVSRQALLLLNADGTPDASFNAGAGPNAFVLHMLEQPNGKLLMCGAFTQFNGLSTTVIVRLNPDGTLDTAFRAAAPYFAPITVGTQPNQAGFCMALQADGKILVGGRLDGRLPQMPQGYSNVVRLLTTGRIDSTFQTGLVAGLGKVFGLTVLADGKILVVDSYGHLTRLLPTTGRLDAILYNYLGAFDTFDDDWVAGAPLVQVQPGTGRIIVKSRVATIGNTTTGALVAFTPGGLLDATFNNGGAASYSPNWVHMLATGELLVTGLTLRYGGTTTAPTPLALLTPTGQRNNALPAVLLQTVGAVNAMALQPDGKILVGGDFTEINGLAVSGGLARLQANGIPDSLYCVTAAPPEARVTTLALQADGKLLVAGDFTNVGGGRRPTLARLLPSGQLDVTYQPSLSAFPSSYPDVAQVLVQTDGKALIRSYGIAWGQSGGNAYQGLVRLLDNGQLDSNFHPSGYGAQAVQLQPDGKILASGYLNAPNATLWRWLPTGALDNSFAAVLYTPQRPTATLLAQDGQGRIVYQYQEATVNAATAFYLGRLEVTGQVDAAFNVTLNNQSVTTMQVQPNQRLLAGILPFPAIVSAPATMRLLPSGSTDPSYQAFNGPGYRVNTILIQPNGAVLMAGSFANVSSLPTNGLARFIDANVLAVASKQSRVPPAVWPVPARDVLHVRLNMADQPRTLALLDALGRVVLRQPVIRTETTLNTATLPTGVYVLRVECTAGVVIRRVAVE
ncbi:T9SS type A sorting domain-containing protein [Hymenobacter ruricola]|uniref:T9SS type A sorting domain-containing protein n=1 Tax=Hymenobacter ruricola TaxID=2791023 RepID=A0ABS0IB06_9BACT|nr:T9SS type A sorting domain-containing protein [Hymenobacter ruricola]MBF9223757.1 T9SS type A sorting domain-containing protein [Hymenobacter ruricola]